MEPQKRAKCTQNIARGGDDRLEPQRCIARVRRWLESISRRLKQLEAPGRGRWSTERERNAVRLWLEEEMLSWHANEDRRRQSGSEFGFLGLKNPRIHVVQESGAAGWVRDWEGIRCRSDCSSAGTWIRAANQRPDSDSWGSKTPGDR
ncbi:hypothetical protein BDZ89DRAFT_1084840 [Hymenopellis radicata]|nr:hypothetical protein BDZ89DRAFT_1084840 [Hymenopellis radicata]